ncbi:MAG: NAD(P)H-dependent oxidoreductase subunit E [Clostridiales Family XIII bacterium]|nr:NAD(P)H-dependent oxidoreductase subunit E [Clostridiales Family XIII bacterium]
MEETKANTKKGAATDTDFDYSVIDEILTRHGAQERAIIAILQEAQERYRYLPAELFLYLSQKMKVSEARLYSVATFYENFSLEPKGKYVIKICDGTACHVRKSIPILERIRSDLGLSSEVVTTEDLGFTVETVSCLGACGLAPVITVNDKVYPTMTPGKANELIEMLKEELKGGNNANDNA